MSTGVLAGTLRRRGGVVVVVIALGLYFGVLFGRGASSEAWESFRVPASSYTFKDLLSVTAAWECVREGVDPRELMTSNRCDPAGQRPANYPRVLMWPGHLGLGQGVTTPFGVALALAFFGSVLWLARRATIGEGFVWAIAATSPPVMLGVERGNVDLLVFVLLVASAASLRAPPPRRVGAHALMLLAAVFKLFPAFAFVALLRQEGRWRTWGVGSVVLAFGAYCLVTLGDIKTFVPAVPRQVDWSFGAAVIPDALDLEPVGPYAVVLVALGLALALVVAWRRRSTWHAAAADASEEMDAFVIGAAIFCGSFAVFQSWDYRLAVLLLVLPRLLAWSREPGSPVPPRLTVAVTVAGLWLSGEVTARDLSFPWDELALWGVFVLLAAGLGGALSAQLRAGRRPEAPAETRRYAG